MKILNLWERVIYALRAPEPGEFGFGISRDINDLLRSIHLIYSVVRRLSDNMFGIRVGEKYFSSMEWLGGKLDRVKITWQKSLAGLGAAQRIDSSYSDERNDLTGKISNFANSNLKLREKISIRK